MSTAHTPGPWIIKFDFNVFGNGHIVAGCGGYSSNAKSEEVHAENVANARLIAAAPALLAALQGLLRVADRSACQCKEVDAARAALASATP